LYLIFANVLEGTKLRSIAISGIQFGKFFKNPSDILPVISDIAWSTYNHPSNTALKTLGPAMIHSPIATESGFKELFSLMLKQHNVDDIAASISGVTRPKDRLYELISRWRVATQDSWEDFVTRESLSPEVIDIGLKSPRFMWGIRWKVMILDIADKVRSFISGFSCLWLYLVIFV